MRMMVMLKGYRYYEGITCELLIGFMHLKLNLSHLD